MKPLFLGLLLAPTLAAVQPLQVAGVVRTGLPPFDEGERLYRLEGSSCQALRVSELLTLQRSGERRNLGRLQVTAVKDGYALARLAVAGETYPLKGDLAVRHEMLLTLPPLPPPSGELSLPPEARQPRAPRLPIPPSPASEGARREPIYFLKGSAELSPAALVKLKAWVEGWGLDGRWILLAPAVPELPAALAQGRVEVLKEALGRLGVAGVELQVLPARPPARYDAIIVSKEPW